MKKEKRFFILAAFSLLFVVHYFLFVWNGDGLIYGLLVLPSILFFMMGVGCFLRSIFLYLDRSILKSVQDVTMLKEGGRIAVLGTIEPENEQLSSPYSTKECVLYEYQIYHKTVHKQRQSSDSISYYPEAVGWAFVPSSVKTQYGSFNFSDYPNIVDFPEKIIEGGLGPIQHFDLQAKFVKLNRILTLFLPTLVAFIPSLSKLLFLKPPGEDGVIRTDIDYSGKQDALHADKIEERIVPSGASVIAIGTFDSKHNALTSGWNDLRLISADSGLEKVQESVRVEIIAYFVGSIFLIACWLFLFHMMEIWEIYATFLR